MISPHLESCSGIYSLRFSVFKDVRVLVEKLQEFNIIQTGNICVFSTLLFAMSCLSRISVTFSGIWYLYDI